MKFKEAKILDLPKIEDSRGNLTVIETDKHIPFNIMRAYWIYDVPGGETRGGHAFKEQDEFIVALSGSFDIVVDNGKRKRKFSLNRSYFGLNIPAGNWRSMENFSTNSLALVLASTKFDENDYIRNYSDFLSLKTIMRPNFIKPLQPESFYSIYEGFTNTVDKCSLLELDKNHKIKGNITVIENQNILPFDIQRLYYLYDVPGGEERGGHAHKELRQLIIAASGSFDVTLDDGFTKKTITLNRPYLGLLVVPGIWRELNNFSSGSVCLVLASHIYDERDYIREYEEFLNYKK